MTNTTIQQASNSEVVSKYGRARIMRRAWSTLKYMTGFDTLSQALSFSWASFRGEINRARENAARHAAQAARYNGSHNVRSPLNPDMPARFSEWGRKGNTESINVMASR